MRATLLMMVHLVAKADLPFADAAVAETSAAVSIADVDAAVVGIAATGDSSGDLIQVISADGAPLELEKGTMAQLLELMKANKLDPSVRTTVQRAGQTLNFVQHPQPQQQTLAYPWHALPTARDRLADHFRHGLDPTAATFIFLENQARGVAGLPWGEAGAVDAERILSRLAHFVESLPLHSLLAVEGRFQHAVLRGLTRAPNASAHGIYLEDETSHLEALQATALAGATADGATADGVAWVQSAAGLHGAYTASEALDSLNGRLRWLKSLIERRDDTLGLTLELCARFAFSESSDAAISTAHSLKEGGSASPNLKPRGERARLVAIAEALVEQAAERDLMREARLSFARKEAQAEECVFACTHQWPEEGSTQEHACFYDCFDSPASGAKEKEVHSEEEQVQKEEHEEEEPADEKAVSVPALVSAALPLSQGLSQHIDAKHVVRTMVRALHGGDAWVAAERRRVEARLQAAQTAQAASASASSTAETPAGAGEAATPAHAAGVLLGGAPAQLGRARALSHVLYALDRCRVTPPDWSASQPDTHWRYEWCHRHTVSQWPVGSAYAAEGGQPAFRLGHFMPDTDDDADDAGTANAYSPASAVSMLAEAGPGLPESLAYGRQRFVNGSTDGCGNGASGRRASEVHLVCCSGLGGVRFPEGLALAQALGVRQVAESSAARPCRYRIDVCAPLACRHHALSPWFDAVANPTISHRTASAAEVNAAEPAATLQALQPAPAVASTSAAAFPAVVPGMPEVARRALWLRAVACDPAALEVLPADLLADRGGFMGVAEWASRLASEPRWWPHAPKDWANALRAAVDGERPPTTRAQPRPAAAKQTIAEYDAAAAVAAAALAAAQSADQLSTAVKSRAARRAWEAAKHRHAVDSGSSSRSIGNGSGSSGSNSSSTTISGRGAKAQAQARRFALRERARSLVRLAYRDYMAHAYPMAELLPLSCRGGHFGLVNVSLITLVDALDTLAVIGDAREFKKAVGLVRNHFTAPRVGGGGGVRKGQGGRGPFDFDVTVSVFEANIRLLGGLLSAHLLATHPEWWDPSGGATGGFGPYGETYDGALLDLAIDLGERLLPAFDTTTGIPFGSINLRRGVDPTETPVASLAGAGSLALEMQMLSHLSGDPRFGCAARAALLALFVRRSLRTGLLGKHIDVASGAFTEDNAGIGSTADSFYEYLAKMALLFGDTGCWHMFSACATAAEAWSRFGDWYGDVEAHSGTPTRPIADALQGFWPGLLASLGDVGGASRSLNAFFSVAHSFGAPGAPEEFDFLRGSLPAAASGGRAWLLRPELLESAMHLRQATKGRGPNNDAAAESWLAAGEAAVEALERVAKVGGGQGASGKPRGCGFAAVADVTSMAREDSMPSYFLSETLKYIFLLFDDENWSHGGRGSAPPFVWTTEGHPLPILPAARVDTTPGGVECGGFHGVMRGGTKAAAGDATAADAADEAEAAAIKKGKGKSLGRGLLETIGGVFRQNKSGGGDNKSDALDVSAVASSSSSSSPPPPVNPVDEWVFAWPFRGPGDGLPRSCPNPDWLHTPALPTRAPPGSGLYSAAAAREGPWAAPRFLPDALLFTTE